MSQPQGTLQNLNDGSQESLRALIQSLVPEASVNSNGKFSGDVVGKLTEKLSQLVGPDAVQEYKDSRNERGELINEEGLPIIDINEPVDIATKLQSAGSIPPLATVEPLLPLATLPPSARERLRERRNRILDMLEQEEQETQQRESEEAGEVLQEQKEEAAREMARRKDAKELQKKMGRALLQNMSKEKQREEQEKEAQRLRDEEAEKRRSPSIKKKTVAFVESTDNFKKEHDDKAESSSKIDWGDVTPARLQNTKRPTLLSQSLLDKHPMKMSVVERVPGGQPTAPKPPSTPRQFSTRLIDSDDESDPDDSSSDIDDAAVLEEDDIDLDYAHHQREVALEYYKQRNTIGQIAAAAMMNHSHSADELPDTNPDVVQDSTKPGVSQFRASRFASAYNATIPTTSNASTSLAGSVIPASSTRTIQRAIRTGKIDDNGKLVGEEGDSASEQEDEGLQEVLNLLRKGEVYNIGPDGNYIHAVRPNPNEGNIGPSGSQAGPLSAPQGDSNAMPPPNLRPKTSRFKASRAAAGRPAGSSSHSIPSLSSPTPSDTSSPSVTPISYVGRSSPKLGSDLPSPDSSVVAERIKASIESPSPSKHPQPSPFSMIVESPLFPMPHEPPVSPTGQPEPSPMIISSPSFPPSTSSGSRRPDRPPPVLATSVIESRRTGQAPYAYQDATNDGPEKKISRFRAERM
ncbi:hypothetical protein BDN70DRAFT_872181 [Pholiota conissans]|uniref:DUF3835 domain-containing protein n=1 Tax=Pholiota conissans TaxID=109636 RepID=A0A9P5ZDI1_9AGAR|nr:hypothetical protein BDN70DRAFT_872181 [Pholiota conissans]